MAIHPQVNNSSYVTKHLSIKIIQAHFQKSQLFFFVYKKKKQRDDERIQRRSEEASEQDDGSDG